MYISVIRSAASRSRPLRLDHRARIIIQIYGDLSRWKRTNAGIVLSSVSRSQKLFLIATTIRKPSTGCGSSWVALQLRDDQSRYWFRWSRGGEAHQSLQVLGGHGTPTADLVSCSATRLSLSRCARQRGVWSLPRCGRPHGVHVLQRFEHGARPSHGYRLREASPPPDGVLLRSRDVQFPYELPCSGLLLTGFPFYLPDLNMVLPIAFVCCGYFWTCPLWLSP